jgi:gluconolactonase
MKKIVNTSRKGCKYFVSGLVCALVILTSYSQSPVPQDAELEKIAEGFQFVEGPVWIDGIGLLFSDIPANTVYKWTAEGGAVSYLSPSGNSNGLALDLQGRLLLAQHGNRRIARIEENGTETALATHYNGKRLNSPNDLAVKSDGSIFFTDPAYGISPGQEELDFSGIYRISPDGVLYLLDSTVSWPNGIAFTPDETKLYVGDSQAGIIYVYDVVDDTLIANRQQFAFMSASGGTDGMKTDGEGYLFSSGPFGIWVYAADGTVLDTIEVPGQTTNCNWGDDDRQTLYITSGSAVYRIRLGEPIVSSVDKKQSTSELRGQLYSYPNPFSSETTILYTVPFEYHVSLKVFDVMGNEVRILVDKKVRAGQYSIVFNAANLTESIYLCRLQAGDDFTELSRIMCVR